MEKTLGRLKPQRYRHQRTCSHSVGQNQRLLPVPFILPDILSESLFVADSKLRQDFPIDKEIFDILDVDAHQVS